MQRFGVRVLTVVACAAMASSAFAAATYRWVDAQGVVHYSDTPQPGAQEVPLPAAQTYHPAPAPAVQSALAPEDIPASYQSCAIVQPAPDQSLFAPESVHVSVQLMPQLRIGDLLSVTLDGAPLAPVAGATLEFQAPDVDRGTHTVNAVVRDRTGKMVCSASAVTFYVQRPSLLTPASPARGH